MRRSRSASPSSKPGRRQSSQPTSPPITLGDELFAAGRSGQGDHGVGMEMVDVRRVHEGVQRSVDRRHCTAIAEMARAVEVDDVVLVHAAAVDVLEREDAIEHEERHAGLGERPEVATGSLHREHADEFTRDRVREGELR